MIVLSRAREIELVEALADAFTPEDLESRVMSPLGVPPVARSASRAHRDRIEALIAWASTESRLSDLLRTARQANSQSVRLRLLNETTGLMPASSDAVAAIRGALPPDGETAWLRALAEVQRQVCRITIASDQRYGTGFLVGPDAVMTNYHLFATAPSELPAVLRRGVAITFDDADGAGEQARIADDPIIFVSTSGPLVLRIDRSVGREITQQATQTMTARARGWIVPGGIDPPPPDSAVVIAQASDAGFVAIAVDPEGFVEASGGGTVISYRTATRHGALGAPCFDARWRLIGMHLGSGMASGRLPANQGLSIAAIVHELRAADVTWDASAGVRARSVVPHGHALDDLVRTLPVVIDDPLADVWEHALPVQVTAEQRWAWAEAAAVVASYDPERLKPLAPAPAAGRVAVQLESQLVRRPDGEERWILSDRVRIAAIGRLARRNQLAAARSRNPGDPTDPLDVLFGAVLTGGAPRALREPDQLRAMLRIVGWLDGLGLALPARDDLRAALERATLVAPFRHLSSGFFAGREKELARLREYVDATHGAPLMLQGPGGMGKSALLAHFILAHADYDAAAPESWRPFVYLDFDRPDLDARDQIGVLRAIVRQLGPQVPRAKPSADALLARWTERKRDRQHATLIPRATALDVDAMMRDVAALVTEVSTLTRAPLLLVLDTLEEVQFASPDAIAPMIAQLAELARQAPALRPVLAGRIELGRGVGQLERMVLSPLPARAAEALLANDLPADLAANRALVSRIAKIIGGNPLSLRLAAEMLRRESENVAGALASLGADDLWRRVGDAIVQGRLYERILGHIHDAQVRALAYPGLILRRLTWELIRDVLAGPCQLVIPDDDAARSLFDRLATEVALVRQGEDSGVLELRPELRRIVCDDLARDPASATQRAEIHAAAVRYYAARDGKPDRAEEIYHRLALDDDPREIDKRWVDGLETLLRGAIDELPERARTYLAGRVGIIVDPEHLRSASQLDWEVWVEARASDLLRFGSPRQALDVLEQRAERLPTSRLHLIESVARRSLETPDLAGAERAARRAVASGRASDTGSLRDALDELAQVQRLRDDHAGLLHTLADLAELGDQLGDDLIVLRAQVETLETLEPGAPMRLSDQAIRVFGRLPDELIARAPELARRVAAQAGGDAPATLQRVVRLVGLGSVDETAANRLQGVLLRWSARDPDIGRFIPARATPRELANATQYLVANRAVDQRAADELAEWLRGVIHE